MKRKLTADNSVFCRLVNSGKNENQFICFTLPIFFSSLATAPPQQAYQQPQYAGGYPDGPPEQAYPQSQGPAPSHGGLLSNCQGNKKALLIGINYFGQSGELRGCVNDVNNIKQLIMSRGFRESNMMILTDDQRDSRCHPTRQNIIEGNN